MKAKSDYHGSIAYAAEEAKAQEKLVIAKELKADGVALDKIVKYTRLSIEEVEKL